MKGKMKRYRISGRYYKTEDFMERPEDFITVLVLPDDCFNNLAIANEVVMKELVKKYKVSHELITWHTYLLME